MSRSPVNLFTEALAIVCAVMTVFAGITSVSAQTEAPPNPPVAKKQPKTTTLHGVTLVDDYPWLRDKDNPEVTIGCARWRSATRSSWTRWGSLG